MAVLGNHAHHCDLAGPLTWVLTDAEGARREGFTGKLAIHPAQVAVINAAFTPSPEDVAHAEEIVAAFEAQPDAGVLSVGGKMVDRPHLVQAKRILERASR